jgi:hypothetical protein
MCLPYRKADNLDKLREMAEKWRGLSNTKFFRVHDHAHNTAVLVTSAGAVSCGVCGLEMEGVELDDDR